MEIEELPPMKHAVWYYNYLVVNNCLWIFGGEDEDERKPVNCVEMYNPVTNEWIDKPSLRYERAEAKCATVNDKIFVCGGSGLDWENHRTIEVFDLNSETWTLLNTEIPFDPAYFRVAALDNFLMFCKRTVSKTKFWKLNVDTLEWTELPSRNDCYSMSELIEIDDKLVHFGQIAVEYYDEKEPICVDIFDGQRWRKGPSLYYGTYLFSNVVVRSPTLIDKLVSLVIEEEEQDELRGELDRVNSTDEAPFLFKENTYILMYAPYFKDDDGRETKFNFCLLDCHKMEWKTLDIKLDKYLRNMIIMDDQIYFLHGEFFFKLNLETMQTEQLPFMKYTIYNNYLVVNNCLWIFGGEDEDEQPVNYVEMYNPVTNEWIEKPSLLRERYCPECATTDDKIYVCGGSQKNWKTIRTIEVFDLNSETWTLLNTEIPFDSIHFRVAALDNFLMFCKLSLSKTKFWKLNVDTLEWTELPSTIACTSRRELIRIEDKLVHIGKIYRSHDEKEPIRVDIFDGQRWIIAASLNCGAELFNNVVVRSPTLIDKLVSLVIEE